MRSWPVLCLILFLPRAARSDAPSPPNTAGSCSQVPVRIVLVGTDGAQLDADRGRFDVLVCKWTRPLQGASVAILPASAGVRLGSRSEPPALYSGGCLDQSLRFFSDASGMCRITLSGSVDLAQQVPGVAPALRVYADGVWFGDVPVLCYDLDGGAGLGASDLAQWLSLFSSGGNYLVADYNASGALDADDLSLWLDAFASGRESVSAPLLCP